MAEYMEDKLARVEQERNELGDQVTQLRVVGCTLFVVCVALAVALIVVGVRQ